MEGEWMAMGERRAGVWVVESRKVKKKCLVVGFVCCIYVKTYVCITCAKLRQS